MRPRECDVPSDIDDMRSTALAAAIKRNINSTLAFAGVNAPAEGHVPFALSASRIAPSPQRVARTTTMPAHAASCSACSIA